MGVMTPHRGIKILTRAGEGLQNSDTELEQLICQILGDEIHSGSTLVARDGGLVGGNSIDEFISNWEKVISKLHLNNMKIVSNKLKIAPTDTKVYGFRVINGTIKPSDHIVNTLGKINIEDLNTVKQVN